jgi:hypothetical protein
MIQPGPAESFRRSYPANKRARSSPSPRSCRVTSALAAYRPPGCFLVRLSVPGPTFPWLEGLAVPLPAPVVMPAPVSFVMLEDDPIVDWCRLCFFDMASAVNVEPANAAIVIAVSASFAFITNSFSNERADLKLTDTIVVPMAGHDPPQRGLLVTAAARPSCTALRALFETGLVTPAMRARYSAASTLAGFWTAPNDDTAGPLRAVPSGANCEP